MFPGDALRFSCQQEVLIRIRGRSRGVFVCSSALPTQLSASRQRGKARLGQCAEPSCELPAVYYGGDLMARRDTVALAAARALGKRDGGGTSVREINLASLHFLLLLLGFLERAVDGSRASRGLLSMPAGGWWWRRLGRRRRSDLRPETIRRQSAGDVGVPANLRDPTFKFRLDTESPGTPDWSATATHADPALRVGG